MALVGDACMGFRILRTSHGPLKNIGCPDRTQEYIAMANGTMLGKNRSEFNLQQNVCEWPNALIDHYKLDKFVGTKDTTET